MKASIRWAAPPLCLPRVGGSFLKAYPAEEMAVNIPQLLAIVQKAASISDLVRFFSDAPLDGLR
jgi:hypothetical protein